MATAKNNEPHRTSSVSRRLMIITASFAALCLLIFNVAFWFNRYIFSTATFTDTATPALLSESSTQALATEVSDRLLESRPVLRSTLDDQVIRLIAALLNTSVSERIVKKSVTTLQVAMTSNNPQEIAIDLSGLKNIIAQLLTVGRSLLDRPTEEQRIDINDIPDKIVLLNPKNLPNIYALGVTMLWLAPITFFAALILIAHPIYKSYRTRRDLKQLLAIQGGLIVVGGLIALAIGPLIKPLALGPVTSPNIRIVIENLLDAFVVHLNQQSLLIMITPGVLLVIAAIAVHAWPTIQAQMKLRSKN